MSKNDPSLAGWGFGIIELNIAEIRY